MTVLPAAAPGQPPAPGPPSRLGGWEARDPELRATKRALRAAVLVPGVFALADFGIGNPQTTLFSVFGAFALLLFADFGGRRSTRFRSYLGLFLAGAVLITAGTLCSSHAATAVLGMAVFGFAVLFAGAVSPQAAVGATAALLTFVLPVAVPVGASAIGSRLAGWALAGAFCLPAVMLVWSERWHDPLRRKAADAAGAVADLVDAHAEGHIDVEAKGRVGLAMEALREPVRSHPVPSCGRRTHRHRTGEPGLEVGVGRRECPYPASGSERSGRRPGPLGAPGGGTGPSSDRHPPGERGRPHHCSHHRLVGLRGGGDGGGTRGTDPGGRATAAVGRGWRRSAPGRPRRRG